MENPESPQDVPWKILPLSLIPRPRLGWRENIWEKKTCFLQLSQPIHGSSFDFFFIITGSPLPRCQAVGCGLVTLWRWTGTMFGGPATCCRRTWTAARWSTTTAGTWRIPWKWLRGCAGLRSDTMLGWTWANGGAISRKSMDLPTKLRGFLPETSSIWVIVYILNFWMVRWSCQNLGIDPKKHPLGPRYLKTWPHLGVHHWVYPHRKLLGSILRWDTMEIQLIC